MHVLFIPYGKRDQVEILLREMESQKYIMPLTKEGCPNEGQITGGGVRHLPLGVCDYVFPKEGRDKVIATLEQHSNIFAGKDSNSWSTGLKKKAVRLFLSRLFNFKPIPKDYDDSEKLQWYMRNVRVLVLGYREHGIITERYGELAGWSHEAL